MAVAIAGLAAVAGAAPAAGAASFDWSMPDRYSGGDGNGDGLIDSYEPDGPLDPTPDGFRVDFAGAGADACGAESTVWSIEGDEVAAGDPGVAGGDPRSCSFSYRFAREGTYEVTLEGRDADGKVLAAATNLVRVQDFLVVSLGDSVASGEGNPEAAGTPAGWQNTQCHRSALAGPARAARALEAADPRTSVTFVHLACSGATIDEGLLGPYRGVVGGAELPPQVDVLEALAAEREVDVVTISIGANDVEFSQIVEDCFIYPECDQSAHLWSVAPGFEARRQALAGRYGALAARLGTLDLRAERVHLSEYFDPTRDRAGQPCPGEEPGAIGILGDHPAAGVGGLAAAVLGPLVNLPATPSLLAFGTQLFEVSRAEAEWASNVMMSHLNAEVASAASGHGWEYVGDIFQPFMTHGYCASGGEHWVVRWQESMDGQGDQYGTLHPNGPGHEHYARRIEARVAPALYTTGEPRSPRRPRQRLEIQGRDGSGEFRDIVGSVERGHTVAIRARVSGRDAAGRDVALELQGPGSLSANTATTDAGGVATITYTAPDPVEEIRDRARVVGTLTDGGEAFRDSVAIELVHVPIEITVDPQSAHLVPGDVQQFRANVVNTHDTAVTWSATGGEISSDGVYTAGQTAGVYDVRATSVADTRRSATASVTIGPTVFGMYEGSATYDDPEGGTVVSHEYDTSQGLVLLRERARDGGAGAELWVPFHGDCGFRISEIGASGGSFSGHQEQSLCNPGAELPWGRGYEVVGGSVAGGSLTFSTQLFSATEQIGPFDHSLTRCYFFNSEELLPLCS